MTYGVSHSHINGTPGKSNSNYIHTKATSIVGNAVYGHAQYSYDTNNPTFNFQLPSEHVNTRTVQATLSNGVDANLYKYKITSGSSFDQGLVGWTA